MGEIKYQDERGNEVMANDDDRILWYGSGKCGHWTDDWTKFSKNKIPSCPKCGCVGFQITAKEWFDGIKKYADDGHPEYAKEIEALKL